ncbi:hypothetical protein [uncultured Chitinophaga sp.]|uniref:hypothetical protein n=1 Tax=uncultured Chitinophaga sp. TaxID=339340 RepID=UPI0025DEB0ED|nr:hypothetical protein [uncultured Chitinophaga sp.]
MKWLLPLLLLALFSSCSKSDSAGPDRRTRWVETSLRKDTITFPMASPDGKSAGTQLYILELRVGLEPFDSRHFNSSYVYELSGDSIQVSNLLSSSRYGEKYFFKLNDSKTSFQVGNFYHRIDLPDILEFTKL